MADVEKTAAATTTSGASPAEAAIGAPKAPGIARDAPGNKSMRVFTRMESKMVRHRAWMLGAGPEERMGGREDGVEGTRAARRGEGPSARHPRRVAPPALNPRPPPLSTQTKEEANTHRSVTATRNSNFTGVFWHNFTSMVGAGVLGLSQ